MVRTLCTIVGLLAASLIAPAYAQESAPEAPDVGDEVVVRGRRMSDIEDGLRAEIGKFIGEIAAPPAGRGLARWDRRVCIGVHNLEQVSAQYLVDRISKLALDVGLTPGEPGCGPNVIIIFTTDGRKLATQLVENKPVLAADGRGRRASRSRGARPIGGVRQSSTLVAVEHAGQCPVRHNRDRAGERARPTGHRRSRPVADPQRHRRRATARHHHRGLDEVDGDDLAAARRLSRRSSAR